MAAKLFGARRPAPKADLPSLDAIRDALYASKIVAYSQGFEQMEEASKQYGWNFDLAGIATIWRGGCIIRAKFLDRISDVFGAPEETGNLYAALFPRAHYRGRGRLAQRRLGRRSFRRAGAGVPASLSYFDGLRRENGPTNLIQGQRDYFVARTFHRTDGRAPSTCGGRRTAGRCDWICKAGRTSAINENFE